MTGAIKGTPHASLYHETGWETLALRRQYKQLCSFYNAVHNATTVYFSAYIPYCARDINVYNVRNVLNLTMPACNTSFFQKCFFNSSVFLWNSLEISVRNSGYIKSFKSSIKVNNISCKPWYYYGIIKLNVIHSKLRMDCR